MKLGAAAKLIDIQILLPAAIDFTSALFKLIIHESQVKQRDCRMLMQSIRP